MTDVRRHFLEQIRRGGETLSPELAAAFAGVPREAFVPDGFQRRDGSWAQPADPDFLATVYRDDVLVTKVEGRVPVSSSSQPSLMAVMITALQVRPGLRILEVGAGTGYNAALLATLGASVTSVDVQADVADRARTALARAGVAGVRVEQGDGYEGLPGERFDRIIVTVGVSGISPRWLEQLDPGGLVIAPVVHAGTHPVLAVRGLPSGPVTAAVVCPSGFMTAAGPLTAAYPGSHPPPAGALAGLTEFAGPRFAPPLGLAYRDLWYAAGAWSSRATQGLVTVRHPGPSDKPGQSARKPGGDHEPAQGGREQIARKQGGDREPTQGGREQNGGERSEQARAGREQGGQELSCLVLLGDDRAGGAAILPDGSVLTGGTEAAALGAEAVGLLDRWAAARRPPMRAWRIGLGLAGEPEAPIWVPRTWELPR